MLAPDHRLSPTGTVSMGAQSPTTFRLADYKPLAPLLAFFALLCMPYPASFGGGISLSVFLAPLVLVGYAHAGLDCVNQLLPGARRTLLALLVVVVLFAGWSFVTAFGADQFLRVFRPIYAHLSGICVVLGILATSRSAADARRTRNALLIVFFGLLIPSLIIGGGLNYGDRSAGFFKHPNQLGIVAAMFVCFSVGGLLGSGGRSLWYWCTLPLTMLALFMSGSKTNLLLVAALSAVIALINAMLNPNRTRAVTSAISSTVMVSMLLAASVMVLPLVNPRAADVLRQTTTGSERVGDYNTVTDRQEIWSTSWRLFLESPLTGVGAGQLLPDGTEHSHNIAIDTLRTTGVPGFVLILTFHLIMLAVIIGAIKASRDVFSFLPPREAAGQRGLLVGLLIGMFCYLAANEMSDSFGPSTLPFLYTFLGLSLAMMRDPTWDSMDRHDVYRAPPALPAGRSLAGPR